MRMWLINPEFLCRKHLLGEHVEMHMFIGTISAGKSLEGYLRDKLVNVPEIKQRHDQLAEEMISRGMNHNSPIEFQPETGYGKSVDPTAAAYELGRRCVACRNLMRQDKELAGIFKTMNHGGDGIHAVDGHYTAYYNGVDLPVSWTTHMKATIALERHRRRQNG